MIVHPSLSQRGNGWPRLFWRRLGAGHTAFHTQTRSPRRVSPQPGELAGRPDSSASIFQQAESQVKRKSKVFIVDDHTSVRSSLEALLTVQGYDVRTFPSATHFLAHHHPTQIGCVLVN